MNLQNSHNPNRKLMWNGKYLARCSRDELMDCVVALVKLLSDTKDVQTKKESSIKVFVDGKETINFQKLGSSILVQPPIKKGRFWSLVSSVPLLRNWAYKSNYKIIAQYEYKAE
jgi:hypothetical protein